MSLIHSIKRTNTEAVLKCYSPVPSGGSIDIDPSAWYITGATEQYDPSVCGLSIKALYCGAKKDKQIDIVRVVPTTPQFDGDHEWDASGVHSHYYLINSGYYEYKGFVDNTYKTKPIRIIGDGAFHLTLVLGKTGWRTKIELAEFGSYDDPLNINQ